MRFRRARARKATMPGKGAVSAMRYHPGFKGVVRYRRRHSPLHVALSDARLSILDSRYLPHSHKSSWRNGHQKAAYWREVGI